MKFLHYFWIVLWFFMFDFFSQGINVFIHIFFFITSVISKFIAVIYISWIPQIYHKYHRGIITIAVDFGEKEREKEREKAISRGLGGRPARERPCRRRSPFPFGKIFRSCRSSSYSFAVLRSSDQQPTGVVLVRKSRRGLRVGGGCL